jgi:soluble lytic murein transglycosylase-like protein
MWLSCAYAGTQKEEDLADSVRSALAAQIADRAAPEPHFDHYEQRLAYLKWLGDMSNRLTRRKPNFEVRTEFLKTVWYEAKRAGLEPSLVLGLIQVESNFRKHAISYAGAIGYMQVMPFWTRALGDGDTRSLFDMRTNLRYGCTILRHYLNLEKGDLFLALGRYNGSRGRREYPDAILAAWKHWQ